MDYSTDNPAWYANGRRELDYSWNQRFSGEIEVFAITGVGFRSFTWADSYILSLSAICKSIDGWLNEVRINRNKRYRKWIRKMFLYMNKFAHFEHIDLRSADKSSNLYGICSTYRRIKGLV